MNKHQVDYDMHMISQSPRPADPSPPIDWDMVAEIFPPAVSALCWILWGMFLLIPSIFGIHHAALFPAANNAVFVLMGFVLCIALSTAVSLGHGFRAVFFAIGIFLLSFWF